MGYYMSGGYYRAGGYYRGGFFSKVGKALGKVSGAAQALAPVATMINPGLGMGMSSLGGIGSSLFGGKGGTIIPGPDVGKLTGPGGGPFGGGGLGFPNVTNPQAIREQLLAQGGKSGSLVATPNGVVLVRSRRRMNPLNPRALSRAYRRLNSASKWAHRLFNVAKPRHGVKPKFGRRRSR